VGRKAAHFIAVQEDLPFHGRVDAGDEVEDGGLSRSVRPDQPPDLSRIDLQVVAVDGPQAAEVVGHLSDLEDRHITPRRPDPFWAGTVP
jgi:hypothetical protein